MEDQVTTIISTPTGDIEASKTKVPESRRFRDAWVLEGEVIEIDMDKAREIAREQIRRERKPALEKLDVAMMRAMEEGRDVSKIIERKQALRDAPADPALDDALDAEALAEIVDDIVEWMKAF